MRSVSCLLSSGWPAISARLVSSIGGLRMGRAAPFPPPPPSHERPASIVFVGAGRDGLGPRADDDVIGLTVEEDGEIRRLIRRRAVWSGPRTLFEDVSLEDPVV